jgi:hypothetical protein
MKFPKLILVVTIIFIACNSSKKSNAKSHSGTTASNKTSGKVSHQYRNTGCNTVIVVANSEGDITLIPKDKLEAKFDKDGLNIYFNYQTLRMPQPQGCNVGMPAEITDISLK